MKKAILGVDFEIFLRVDYKLILKKGKEVIIINENLEGEKVEVECEVGNLVSVRFEIYSKQIEIMYDI